MGLLDPPALPRSKALNHHKFAPSRRFTAMASASVMASPPTLTMGSGTSAIAGTKTNLAPTDSRLRYLNGPVRFANSKMRIAGNYPNETTIGVVHMDFDFLFDGQVFELWLQADTNTTLRIWVDGQPNVAVPAGLPGGALLDGSGRYLKVDLGSVTRGNARHIRVEGDQMQLIGVNYSSVDMLTVVDEPNSPLVVVVGDSMAVGYGNTAGTSSAASKAFAYTHYLKQILGWARVWNGLAQSGTGFLASATTYRPRITADLPSNADLVILQGSVNDTATATALQAEMQLTIAAVQAAAPSAKIILTGGITPGPYGSSTTLTAGPLAAAAAGIDWLDTTSWFSGSGRDGATVGDGPADWAKSSDNIHPTPAGHKAIARIMARSLRGLLELGPSD